MSLPARSVFIMAHPLCRGEQRIAQAAEAIAGKSKAFPENNRVATQRDIVAINVFLAVRFPVPFTGYPLVAGKTKFSKTVVFPKSVLVTSVCVSPSVLDRDSEG